MQPSDKQPFCLADFQPFLKELTEMEDPSVLIGGMAVAAWADVHLELPEYPLFDLPIYSKDVDLRGRKATSALLAGTMFTSGWAFLKRANPRFDIPQQWTRTAR